MSQIEPLLEELFADNLYVSTFVEYGRNCVRLKETRKNARSSGSYDNGSPH